ncbi:hypothetical protein RvY_17735 [Ramazzottius varieornatus]|uniref:Uncharacterized protein n=1 Tax=Ramazzottius varieornatus TaxID=947166 RepID=A0A1D1W356_RAMVA|nr:hypothetical protein RvY_17735 [Ramazzottius varieornatus]
MSLLLKYSFQNSRCELRSPVRGQYTYEYLSSHLSPRFLPPPHPNRIPEDSGQIALIVIGALLVFGLGGLVWLFGVRRGKSGRERRESHCSDASDMDILRMEELRNVAKNHK